MRKGIALSCFILLFIITEGFTQKAPTASGKQWFKEAKLGLFVNWMPDFPAKKPSSPEEAINLIKTSANGFTANLYQPKEWAQSFKNWGIKYVILTVKNRAGFSLFNHPSAVATAANSSPAGKDLVKEFVEAMKAEGLKVGFQYSLADYSHPHYYAVKRDSEGKLQVDYMKWIEYTDMLLAEMKHLCTAYGDLDILWLDGMEEKPEGLWPYHEIVEELTKHQPNVVLNNQYNNKNFGDYATYIANDPKIEENTYEWWEYFFPLGYDWKGPNAHSAIKPDYELVRIFQDAINLGGNLLINISVKEDGSISDPQRKSIEGLGVWVKDNAEAIYSSEEALPLGLFHGSTSRKGKTLYLIAYENSPNELVVKGLLSDIKSITVLQTNEKLKWRETKDVTFEGTKGWVFIKLPRESEQPIATVLKIEFEEGDVKVRAPNGNIIVWK